MALQKSWVDQLFGRLQIRYGAAFLRQWPDIEPDLVKADWADVLDGVKGDSISYALRFLPEKPPNAIQFRDICRRAPVASVPALPAPDVKADPERVRLIMARLGSRDDASMSLAERCAKSIAMCAQASGRLSGPQRAQLQAMGYMRDEVSA